MTRLAGPFAKLDRADEHISALYQEVQRWSGQEPKPYSLTHHDNPEKTERSYHITIERQPDLINWGVKIGDAVHNLRSALDHIAWQCAGGDGIAPDWTEFPIFKDEGLYLSSARGGGLNKISGVHDTRHRTLFEECQPWRNPDGHDKDALWMLHEFDRVDKHRVITPIVLVPLKSTGQIRVTYPSEEAANAADQSPPLMVTQPQAPIYEGAEIFRVVTSAPFVEVEVNSHFDLGISLEYGDVVAPYRGGINFLLRKMAQHTRRIAEQFRDAGV